MAKCCTLLATATAVHAKTIYVAPNGNDATAGTIDAPLATLPAAYKKVVSGDTVYFRGGTYKVTDEQVMKYKSPYAYVFALGEEETTGVEQTIVRNANEPCGIYNLQGQRVQQILRGKIYIVNGKKVYVR